GNVGIGTAAPTALLHVNGNAQFGLNVNSLTATPLNISLGGTYGSGTPGSVANLKWDMFRDAGANRYGIGMSGGLMEFQAGSAGGHAFFVNQGTEAMRILSGGNIGIGTANPLNKMDVYGNFAAMDASLGQVKLSPSAYAKPAIYALTPAGVTESLVINPAGGNVGIGTTSPGYNLDVSSIGTAVSQFKSSYAGLSYSDIYNSSNNASAGVDLRLVTRNVADTSAVAVDMVKYKNGKFVIHNTETDAASSVVLAVAGADRLTVNAAGNVGIGTAAPTSLLQVGSENFQSNAEVRMGAGNGSQLRLWSVGVPYGNTDTSGRNYDFVIRDVTGGADRLAIDYSTGYVGIGTSTPARALDVAGAIRSTGEMQSTGIYGLRQVQGNYGFMHYSDGAAYYQLLTNSGDQYGPYNTLRPYSVNLATGSVGIAGGAIFAQHGGNVGIGTNPPAYKLDVNGTLRGYGITDSSDIRLKRDVKPLEDSLARLLKLRGVNYFWKDQEKGKGEQIGFIAQEMEKVFPDLV
ncbi:MAG: hypothetical protein EOP11_20960, partial [Proteobacteria bacterium]